MGIFQSVISIIKRGLGLNYVPRKYLTGATNSLAASVPASMAVGDFVTVMAYSATSASCQATWKCTSTTAALPGSAVAGDVTGTAAGALYVLRTGANYYKFEIVGIPNVLAFGAVGDGVTDDILALEAAWTAAVLSGESVRSLVIPQSRYHISRPLVFDADSNYFPKFIDGRGAIFDNAIQFSGHCVSSLGLTVDDSPDHGFVFTRGQGAHHEKLTATACAGSGFMFGPVDKDGNYDYSTNSQVTRCQFSKLVATGNSKHGMEVNMVFSAGDSYLNACTFTECSFINNTMKGAVTTAGKCNYNTFLGLNVESNGDQGVDFSLASQCSFFGGHYVDKDTATGTVSINAGSFGTVLGGRSAGTVVGKWIGINNPDMSGGWFGKLESVQTFSADVAGIKTLTVDTNVLVVDDVNDRVGVGTATPETLLEMSANNSAGTALNVLRFSDTDLTAGVGQPMGRIEFYSNDTSSTGVKAFIQGAAQDSSPSGFLAFGTGDAAAATKMVLDQVGILYPNNDNTQSLGYAARRWSEVFAGNGTINTSDAREKTDVRALSANEVAAAKDIAREVGVFRFLQAVAKKGDGAREHIGMTVQRAIEIMQAHGLDPFGYGFICFDQWPDQKYGEETIQAGDRYGFRYNELTMFLCAGFEARLKELEA